MPFLELPHSSGCLVCGRNNPLGMKLALRVDDATGEVRVDYTPPPHHTGFESIVHGGALATVIDEAMVWAATWRGKRFCFCGEMTVRFRTPVVVGQPLIIASVVEFQRPKLIETTAKVFDDVNKKLVATASGKYVPVTPEQHGGFLRTMLEEPQTATALASLRG